MGTTQVTHIGSFQRTNLRSDVGLLHAQQYLVNLFLQGGDATNATHMM
jgi:hypothetical protein